jgi:hypothetical protein
LLPSHVTGLRRTTFNSRSTIRAARSPTFAAIRALAIAAAKAPASTTKAASPSAATVCNAAPLPPLAVNSANASAGKPRIASWFQTPVSVTARVTALAEKPQLRSIAAESPTPTAGPPGAT